MTYIVTSKPYVLSSSSGSIIAFYVMPSMSELFKYIQLLSSGGDVSLTRILVWCFHSLMRQKKDDYIVCHAMTHTNKVKFSPVILYIYHIHLAFTQL